MKRKLKIKTYKVPINRVGEEIQEVQRFLTDEDLLETEEIELEDIRIELPERSQKVAQYNRRQLVYAKHDTSTDYIKKKIITK